MTIDQAKQVLSAIDHDHFPPTNPSVLLDAARTIYLNQREEPWEGGAQFAIMRVLVWTLETITANLVEPLPSDLVSKIIGLNLARNDFRRERINPFG